MTVTPVRYAVVGYGLAGQVFHAPFIAATPGAELAAIVARSPASAGRATAAHPDAAVVADLARLPELGVDVAVIATPNPSHAELATAALELGLVTVVDKPLATSVSEGQSLIDTAARRGVALTCYQNRRWDSDFRTVRRLLDAGELGHVHRFESRFERWRPEIKPGWKELTAPGSGVLFDLGPHVIDQALQLFGPVVEQYSEVRTLRTGATVPDDVFLALRHTSGTESHLWVSLTAAAPGPRFRVLGSRGAFVKAGLDPQEDRLRAGASVTPALGREPEDMWGVLHRDPESVTVPSEPGDYGAFYAAVTAAVRGDGDLPVNPADALAALRIIEQAADNATADEATAGDATAG